jgi:hypothetical protein
MLLKRHEAAYIKVYHHDTKAQIKTVDEKFYIFGIEEIRYEDSLEYFEKKYYKNKDR